jgi:replication-associated recombination protein RarA
VDDLLLHPRTKAELTALLHDAPHALLFAAPTGTGKMTVARVWAQQLAPKIGITTLEPDEKGTISIEAARTLYQRTRAKQAGHQVVIIDHAEAMSGEAQNAFLKLLEEPRAGLTFILTAPSPEDVLPTIVSRVQVVLLQAVSSRALTTLAQQKKPGLDAQTMAQLLFVAQGRPGMLMTLLNGDDAFTRHKHIMQRAKQLLSAGQYERLAAVQELSKDKGELSATLDAMGHMLQLQLRRDPSPQWVQAADALQECQRRLRQNGNPRAQLVHLFMAY